MQCAWVRACRIQWNFGSNPWKCMRSRALDLVNKKLLFIKTNVLAFVFPWSLPKLTLWEKISADRGLLETLVSWRSCNYHTYDRIKKKQFRLDFPSFMWTSSLFQPSIPLQPLHLNFGAYLGYSFICLYLAHSALGKNTDLVFFHQTEPITAPTFHLSPVLARTAAAWNFNGTLSSTVYTDKLSAQKNRYNTCNHGI